MGTTTIIPTIPIIDVPYQYQWIYDAPEAKHVPQQLLQRLQYIQVQSVRSTTRANYNTSWKKYAEFCNLYKLQTVPVTEMKLCLYAAYRSYTRKAGTILNNFSGIAAVARDIGYPYDASKMVHLNKTKQALKTTFKGKDTSDTQPWTFENCKLSYNYFNLRNYNELVFYTAMIVATTGLLRSSEIFATNKAVSFYKKDLNSVKTLWFNNLKFERNESTKTITHCTIKLKMTKTDHGYADVDHVVPCGTWPLSPCDAIKLMLYERQKLAQTNSKLMVRHDAPLFILSDGTILTKTNMNKRMTELIKSIRQTKRPPGACKAGTSAS
jgi:hypothetical protein